ncbi:hypothetical protein RND71_035025 [Anisodus tanguticus]|uniref:Uncharacterized protein n=1 Tax=Anisodus tanguticus TaxID=243964 RepID=A0AAE1R3E7_9SOLA|nr:hypothetical protein RND71_035025 [Anisodus tanguticus]
MTGSEHNDEFFVDEHDQIRTKTNISGGVQVHTLVSPQPCKENDEFKNEEPKEKVEENALALVPILENKEKIISSPTPEKETDSETQKSIGGAKDKVLEKIFSVLPDGVPRKLAILGSTLFLSFVNYTGLTIIGYVGVALGVISLAPFMLMSRDL